MKQNPKLYIYVVVMQKIMSTLYNNLLKAAYNCLIFILGGLYKAFVGTNRALANTHGALGSTHGTLASFYEGLANTHGTLGSTHGTLANTHEALGSTHGTLAITYRSPVGYPKNYIYQNKAPPH